MKCSTATRVLTCACVLGAFLIYARPAAAANAADATQRLRKACGDVDLDQARRALDDRADVNAVDESGRTLISLLRGMEGKNDTFASRTQTDIRALIALLASKGGVEKDYLDVLLASNSPALARQREVVKAVRQEFQAYGKAKGLKRRTHKERKHEQLSKVQESNHQALFQSASTPDGALVYFRDSGENWADWGDNGSREVWDRQYYLKNGTLYFVLEKSSSGMGDADVQELRTYWADGKIVLAVGKDLSEFWEGMRPEAEQRKLSVMPNLLDDKLMKNLDTLSKEMTERFQTTYKQVAGKLK